MPTTWKSASQPTEVDLEAEVTFQGYQGCAYGSKIEEPPFPIEVQVRLKVEKEGFREVKFPYRGFTTDPIQMLLPNIGGKVPDTVSCQVQFVPATNCPAVKNPLVVLL